MTVVAPARPCAPADPSVLIEGAHCLVDARTAAC